MAQCISVPHSHPRGARHPGGSAKLLAAKGQDRIHVQADLVHDLSNMLTVVLGSLDLLSRQPLNQQAQRQFDRAQWSAGRAGKLTQRMLTTAQNDAAGHVAAVAAGSE